MKIYFVIRTSGGAQETYHPSEKKFVPRNESDGFSRRYTCRAAAIRRAKFLGANCVCGKQWLDIGNAVFTQPGQSFADELEKFMRGEKAVQS